MSIRNAMMAALGGGVILAASLATAQHLAGIPSERIKPSDGNLWYDSLRGPNAVAGASRHRRTIAFTFDDGPDPALTPRLLDLLDARHVRAAFFVLGDRLDGDSTEAVAARHTLRDAWERGHLVGSHGYHHQVLDRMSPHALSHDIDRTAQLIAEAIGRPPVLFRAPFGAIDAPFARGAVFSRGYSLVRWTLDPRDWDCHSAREVLDHFQHRLDRRPMGGIVLLHDVHASTVDAFPLLLDEIERRNVALRASGEMPYEVVGLEEFVPTARSASATVTP